MSYSVEVLADNPVVYWRLGETAGTNAADTQVGNDGTYVGGFTLNQIGIPGADGNPAVLLNGTTGKVTVPDAADVDLGNGPWTVEAWVKITATVNLWQGVVGKQTTSFEIGIAPSGHATFPNRIVLDSSGSSVCRSTTQLSVAGKWYHVVNTYNGTTTGLWYVDGKEDATVQIGTNAYVDNASVLQLGLFSFTAGFLNGTLDEVSIYKAVLSPQRIQAHYIAGIVSPYAGFLHTTEPSDFVAAY